MISKIIANWKCNMKLNNIDAYFTEINNYDFDSLNIGIAIPDIFLNKAVDLLNNSQVNIYAQDLEAFEYGSFTGRTSYEHLIDVGVKHVIIGHSEQRRFNDNTNEIINQKIIKAIKKGFYVVLCIGEPLDVYEEGDTINYLKSQITSALRNVSHLNLDKLTIAYEPIWSIGSGLLLETKVLSEIIKKIQTHVQSLFNNNANNVEYLYGGSINLANIETFAQVKEINGFLIGSASLDEQVFLKMIDRIK